MTAYGKASLSRENLKIEAEIRCLNSKGPDISLRLPWAYRDKEMVVRSMVTDKLERGKIDVILSLDRGNETGSALANLSVAASYLQELKKLAALAGQTSFVDYVSLLARNPEIMKPSLEEPDESIWTELVNLLSEALQAADQFRVEEGKILEDDISLRISNIRSQLLEVEALERNRIQQRRSKLQKGLEELQATIDRDRFEQEMIYYLEKYDFTEEKVRLVKHLDFFMMTMTTEQSQGRKLGFISQEIGREINTLGSKAYDGEIQRVVVLMKDELEKIKEQLGNIL